MFHQCTQRMRWSFSKDVSVISARRVVKMQASVELTFTKPCLDRQVSPVIESAELRGLDASAPMGTFGYMSVAEPKATPVVVRHVTSSYLDWRTLREILQEHLKGTPHRLSPQKQVPGEIIQSNSGKIPQKPIQSTQPNPL